MHESTFRAAVASAGLNPYCFEMANIRDQCSWVHLSGEATTQKAMDLVASAVAKAAHLQPLETRQVAVTPAALVIGAGIAGLQASLDIADAGFQVTLVEHLAHLGGQVANLHSTFPTLEPAKNLLEPLTERVLAHPHIEVLTSSEVAEIKGYVGNFQVGIQQGEQRYSVAAGSIVVAAGVENCLRIRVSGTKGSLEWMQEFPQVLTFKPLHAPAQARTPNGPGTLPLAAHSSRIVAGHPEGFHEGFANIYSDAAEAISARRSGNNANPLALHFPNSEDGLLGVRFVNSVIESSRSNGRWTKC